MSLKLITKSYPIGYSDLLPEGIFGFLENSEIPEFRFDVPTTVILKKSKKKKVVDVKKSTKNRKVPTGLSTIEPTKIKPGKKAKKKRKPSPFLPELEIQYANLKKPSALEGIEADNTVEVSESMLQQVSTITESRTKQLGKLLLANTAPSILAHAAAVNYVSAVMQDSFNIELEEDASVIEAVRDIAKFEVLEFFTRKLKIPKHRKEAIMTAFVDKLTTKTVERMESSLRRENQEHKIKALEAVLASRSKNSGKAVIRNKSNEKVSTDERIIDRPMITIPQRDRKFRP